MRHLLRPAPCGRLRWMGDLRMPSMTEAFLDAFADAWNRHDIEAILAAMTEDCVFQPAIGPEVHGARFVGREEVRRGIAKFFAAYPDSRWKNPAHFIAGDRGVTEWIFSATGPSGPIETNGCDVFTFRDGKIAVKDSYRKQRVG
jgi:ketosteroid isomerase-like protein